MLSWLYQSLKRKICPTAANAAAAVEPPRKKQRNGCEPVVSSATKRKMRKVAVATKQRIHQLEDEKFVSDLVIEVEQNKQREFAQQIGKLEEKIDAKRRNLLEVDVKIDRETHTLQNLQERFGINDDEINNNLQRSYYYDEEVSTYDLFCSITSSKRNARILESLFQNDCSHLTISTYETLFLSVDERRAVEDGDGNWYYFIVREVDEIRHLGNLIRKSNSLKSLFLYHMPVSNSFRDGVATNKSIQELYIYRDVGAEGFECLAPFLRTTNTLKTLQFDPDFVSTESMKSFTSLLRQSQIQSLKSIYIKYAGINDEEFAEFALALRVQPQLEELRLTNLNRRRRRRVTNNENDTQFAQGHITLGDTMKNWMSPCLKVLDLQSSHINDDGMLALVDGMANISGLTSLNLEGNDSITEVGLRALSSLFLSKILSLRSLDLSSMHITDGGMTALAPGLASLKSLRRLDLSNNDIGDVGLEALATAQPDLEALATAQPDFRHVEKLLLGNNASFSAQGLMSLSSVLRTVSSLDYLNLSSNSIDDEGLRAFTMGMREQCTIDSLVLSHNAISNGVQFLAAMTSLRRLILSGNDIGDNYEAMGALVEALDNLSNLEHLSLTRVSSSVLSVLAPVFQHGRSSLKVLRLNGMRIDDVGAIALANGLKGNKTLKTVCFDHGSLTDVGWSSFDKLLCDTSSVNNTYFSNHTLEQIVNSDEEAYPYPPDSIRRLLKFNRRCNNIPIRKILKSHSNLDMTPLLQWKLKLLPVVVAWFQRARKCRSKTISSSELEVRKLSALYQFIGGASHQYLKIIARE